MEPTMNDLTKAASDMTAAAPDGAAAQDAPRMAMLQATQAWVGGMFSPGAPPAPVIAGEEKPRTFDFPPGINLHMVPRSAYGLVTFEQLRNFANLCDEVRIVIEAIKREIRALSWKFKSEDENDKTDYSAEIATLRKFWRMPDGEREFDGWLHSVLEDVLVIDAPALWLDMEGNTLRGVDQIDGAIIRPLLDERGKRPRSPLPAYVQTIKGQAWQWFTADRLLYKPFNLNAQTPYGRSPTEFIIMRINEALRRKLSDTSYWDQTNMPEAMVGLPADWDKDQIKTFQDYFDALLAGNIERLRRIKFMPSNGANLPVHEFRRPAESTTRDEWMIKVACWAFGFLPSELGIVTGSGLGGKGFMEGQQQALYRFGFGPLVQYIESLITSVVRMQTSAPLEFKFDSVKSSEDKVREEELAEVHLRNGVIDLNVWRQRAGQPPIDGVKPFIIVNNVPMLVEEIFKPKPVEVVPPAVADEDALPQDAEPADGAGDQAQNGAAVAMAMDKWLEKARRRMRDGKRADCDPPDLVKGVLPDRIVSAVRAGLAKADTPEDAAEVFSDAGGEQPTPARAQIEADLTDAVAGALAAAAMTLPAIDSVAAAQAVASAQSAYWISAASKLKVKIEPILERAAKLGVIETVQDGPFQVPGLSLRVGVAWDLVNSSAVQWAREYSSALVQGLNETTRNRMAAVIAKWIEDGEALPVLAERLNAVVNDPLRALTIAQTESTRAFFEGNSKAWQAAGVKRWRWNTARDERVCKVCGPRDGKVYTFGLDQEAPPAHVRCRCWATPVLEEVAD
jgi:SPP1 gp7 family putative phage head morphogenesis protein